MRLDRVGRAALVLAALVGACAPVVPPTPPPTANPLAMCRIAPDGGAPAEIADRGIGGTGAPDVRVADRGIGGTGIIAVITGFASVCLGGQEVALDPGVPVTVGDTPSSSAALRAGQVAVLEAAPTGQGVGLRARRVAVRFEVSGPVEAIEGIDGDMLRVAGQPVLVTPDTFGDRPAVGDWVAVSGLRRPDGTIEATRLDRRPPGIVVVSGRLMFVGGVLRLGGLAVLPNPGLVALDGRDVTATGVLVGGALRVDRVVPDLLAVDPGALFGAGVGVLLVETFAVMDGDRVRFGQGFSASRAAGFGPGAGGRAVLNLRRGDAGGLRAVGMGAAGPGAPGFVHPNALPLGRGAAPMSMQRGTEPAPLPDRAMQRPGTQARGRQELEPGNAGRGRDSRPALEGIGGMAGPNPGYGPGFGGDGQIGGGGRFR